MKNNIFSDVDKYTFTEFIQKFNHFEIPPFQRAYDWKDKQINELWGSIVEHDTGYFIGTFVCLEKTNNEEKLIIIDGQQRFITVSLLLTAIYFKFEELDSKLVDVNQSKYIDKRMSFIRSQLYYSNIQHYEMPDVIRLTLGKKQYVDIYENILENNDVLNNGVYLKKLSDKAKRYVKNYKLINKLLDKYLEEETSNINKIKALNYLAGKVADLQIILIVCKSDVDAYDIFEGLNNTGIGLSVADLVKNAVMYSVKKDSSKDNIEEKWNSLEDIFYDIQSALFPRFLRHQWISKNGYISNKQLFKEIKDVKLKNTDDNKILSYVDELKKDASIYIAFYIDKYKSNFDPNLKEETIGRLCAFKYLDIVQVFELLLAYYNKFLDCKEYTENNFNKDLINLWNFCLRAKILQLNPSSYEHLFADQAKYINLFFKKEMDRMSIKFFNDLKILVQDETKDKLFIENFKNEIKYNNNGDNLLLRLILINLVEYKNKTGVTTKKPSIEHILPKEPSNWNLNKDNISKFVNNIGNLTILNTKINAGLSNEKIDIKVRDVFSKSPFELNKDIKNYAIKFNKNPEAAIETRGKDLAILANKIFIIL